MAKMASAAVEILPVNAAQQLLRLFHNVAVMPLICMIYDVVRIIQYHTFDGGGANVKSHSQVKNLLAMFQRTLRHFV